jgi:4-hydroxythreonine-4-phosphate dehydrogenase
MNALFVVISQGDPQGVGPELILRLAADGELRPGDRVLADPARLAALGRELPQPWAAAGLSALMPLVDPACAPGLGQVRALELAVDRVLASPSLALVTAPIDKAACRAEGFAYPGHTEYLAARAGASEVAMLMAGPVLRVALATIHLPLREVAAQLTTADVVRVGRLLVSWLNHRLGIATPRVGVLALNPHAGERGLLGDEESRIVAPAIDRLRAELGATATITGPLPADTGFPAHARGEYDALVAMYHDQGLGPFKLMHFHDGVNVTLGLPFVRTSPDHGTARDIAGRGIADPSSLRAALRLARGGAP